MKFSQTTVLKTCRVIRIIIKIKIIIVKIVVVIIIRISVAAKVQQKKT
jgi:hypothetical protein